MVSAAEGQVTIRERVEITGETVAKTSEMLETPNPAPVCTPNPFGGVKCNYALVENAGFLEMYGHSARHLTGFPSQNDMKVTIIRGDSSWTWSRPMEPVMGAPVMTQVDCREEPNGPVVDSYTSYEYPYKSSVFLGDTLGFGRVALGDTVVSYYVYGGVDLPVQGSFPDSWFLDPNSGHPFWFNGLDFSGSATGAVYCDGLIGEAHEHSFSASHSVFAEGLVLEVDADSTFLPKADTTIGVSVTMPESVTSLKLKVLTHDYGDGQETFTFANHADSVIFPVSNGTLSTYLVSHQYWGVATVIATVTAPSGFIGLSDTVQVPTDSDFDGISDWWENTQTATGIESDGSWDEDPNPDPDIVATGDGISKLLEYQGVLIGGVHHRLTPDSMEVFFDIRGASEGTWAVGQVESQLRIKAYVVEGFGDGSYGGGTNRLMWLGNGGLDPTRNYVRVSDSTTGYSRNLALLDPRWKDVNKGVIIQNGRFVWSNKAVDDITCVNKKPYGCQTRTGGVLWGQALRGKVANVLRAVVYAGSIDNVWGGTNAVSESKRFTFTWAVADSASVKGWTAKFIGLDFGADGFDDLNPFELLRRGKQNDDENNGLVGTLSRQQMIQRVTLHEIGHVLGFPNNKHPKTYPSVMRSGFGPAKTDSFTKLDKNQIDLKRNL
ncbi:MAG: hypothetical protein WBW88_01410 [Rhodothermales bacterium]